MTIDRDEPPEADQSVAEPQSVAHHRSPHVGEAKEPRNAWDWLQLSGLVCLAAGVAVLVVFALTLGGR